MLGKADGSIGRKCGEHCSGSLKAEQESQMKEDLEKGHQQRCLCSSWLPGPQGCF